MALPWRHPDPARSGAARTTSPHCYWIGTKTGRATSATGAPTAVELYSADLGIEMAYFNDDLAFGLPNGIGPEVTQMIDAGVDFIIARDSLNQITYRADSLINPIDWTRQHKRAPARAGGHHRR